MNTQGKDTNKTASIASGILEELTTSNYLTKATEKIMRLQRDEAEEDARFSNNLQTLMNTIQTAAAVPMKRPRLDKSAS